MGSQVGAIIAIGCGGRTCVRQGHQLEYILSYSSYPHVDLNGNEILRLRFQVLGELTPDSKREGPRGNRSPHV